MRISPSQSWKTSLKVFPQGCMWTVCTALWWVLCCPATSRKTSNQHRCQLHSARWWRIFSFSFKLTQQRWHAPTNSTWPTQNSVFTLGWLRMAALPEISYSCFSRDLGEQYQSSLIWDTDLAVTKQLVHSVPRSCCPQPWKTPAQYQRHLVQNSVPLARVSLHICWEAEGQIHWRCHTLSWGLCWHPARSRLARAAEADACHFSQQKHSRVVAIQKRGRGMNKILKVRAWCACEIWFFPNYFT